MMSLEEGMDVRAISLPRPWPQAIVDGILHHVPLVGVSSWDLDDAGVLLALHAAKAYDEELAASLLQQHRWVAPKADACPTGIVAVGEVYALHCPGDYGAWTLTLNPVLTVKPYAMPGQRGVWRLPDALANRVRGLWDSRPVA